MARILTEEPQITSLACEFTLAILYLGQGGF